MRNQNKKLCLMFLVSFVFFNSQTHRFIYQLKFKSNLNDTIYQNDYVVTDINPYTVKSYSKEFLKFDSINKQSKSIFFASPLFEERFVRKIGVDNYINYENLLENVYQYETHNLMDWKIKNEFKNFGIFKVQRAECTFGKRQWTAWFTTEIPLTYGPYKFSGLPGMILEIYDDKNNYIFSFVKNVNINQEFDTSGFLEKYYFNRPIKIDYSKLKKLKIDYYLDPYKELKSGQKKGYFQDEDGNTIEKPNFNQLSKEIREGILKNNNPIDLNNLISYPKTN